MPRATRRGQRGFTLTELLISIALLTLVGTALAGAFGIGFRVLGPTGAQTNLRGNNDLMAFEQQVGADVARATCLGASSAVLPNTGCATFKADLGNCPAATYLLCAGWYQPGDSTCHEVVYVGKALGSDLWVERDDRATGSVVRMTTGGATVNVNLNPTQTSNNGYQWTKQVDISVAQRIAPGLATPRSFAKATFHAIPRASDPLSTSVSGVPPC